MFWFYSLLFIMHHTFVYSDCSLSLKKDFGQPSPVFLKDGRFLAPNKDGVVVMKRSDTLLIACPGDKRNVVVNNENSGVKELEAHCIINDTFRVDRWIGSFSSIRCDGQPWFSTESTNRSCYGGNQIYRIGYKIGKTFHHLYEACFDDDLMTTLYISHELSPRSKVVQTGRRPQFIEGNLFGKVRMAQLYKIQTQAERINSILGANMSATYLSSKQFLTRGHLAARADFPMLAEQRASFHYVNTGPQWMRGNAGDWAALEDALRRRVHTLGRPVTVYTGTFGVMTLEDRKGEMKPFYLDTDENNNDLVPVPLYFYKVIYDTKTKTAAAFVLINSSFYNDSMTHNLTFCDDVCGGNPRYSWLRWRPNDKTFSFCCDYDEFASKIQHLPHLDVEGLFF